MLRTTVSKAVGPIISAKNSPSSRISAVAITLMDTFPSLMGIIGNVTDPASFSFTFRFSTADFWPVGALVQNSLLSSSFTLTYKIIRSTHGINSPSHLKKFSIHSFFRFKRSLFPLMFNSHD